MKVRGPVERFSRIRSLTLALTHRLIGPSSSLSQSASFSQCWRAEQAARLPLANWIPVGIVLFLLRAQRTCCREGPFVTHVGLTMPCPLGHTFPSAPQARGARRGLEWGRWNAWNASCSDRPTLRSICLLVLILPCSPVFPIKFCTILARGTKRLYSFPYVTSQMFFPWGWSLQFTLMRELRCSRHPPLRPRCAKLRFACVSIVALPSDSLFSVITSPASRE